MELIGDEVKNQVNPGNFCTMKTEKKNPRKGKRVFISYVSPDTLCCLEIKKHARKQ